MKSIQKIAIAAVLLGSTAAWAADNSMKDSTRNNASETRRSAGQFVDDATVTAKVKSALAADDTTKAHQINVDTNNGIVSLNGAVDSAAQVSRAAEVAKSVEGVVTVKNNLKRP